MLEIRPHAYPVKQERSRKPGTWPKGKSGNPKGRPRVGNSLAECLRDYLSAPDKGKKSRKIELCAKLYAAGIGDNCVAACRLIFEIMGMLNIEDELSAIREKLAELEGMK